MAAQRVGRKGQGRLPEQRQPGAALQRRQARVTVRYDRGELRRHLELENWIEERLRELNLEQVAQMPEEVNIDDLLELPTDEERGKKLQIMFPSCSQNMDEFISELVTKLHGLHKVEVQKAGAELPGQH